MIRWKKITFWGLIASLGLGFSLAPLPARANSGAHKVFTLQAKRYAFWPAVLVVNPGDRVTIELIPQDVVHGLSIDNYDLNMTADPGQTTSLTFIAGQPGSYTMRCSVTCGAMHPFMIGRLQVGQNDLLWRAAGLALLAAVAGIFWRRV
ncbi:MAG TPA: cupredoxin domain-containing protein [Anaerolineales bacterium]|nr:cupredoxin domain-containing protein [Anaerolineales bacterium]